MPGMKLFIALANKRTADLGKDLAAAGDPVGKRRFQLPAGGYKARCVSLGVEDASLDAAMPMGSDYDIGRLIAPSAGLGESFVQLFVDSGTLVMVAAGCADVMAEVNQALADLLS
jgi:hypothetical protein